MAKSDSAVTELGAAVIVGAALVLATVFLSVQGLKGADDTPLDSGKTTAAGISQSMLANTDPATDIYTAAPACDNFSTGFKKEVPVVGGPLPTARRSTADNTDTCEFQLRKGGWLTVTTTWFPADAGVAGHQRATDALIAVGGTELTSPRIGTAARLGTCMEGACPLIFSHHDLLVRIDLTIGEKKLRNSYQQALLRIAADYASINLQ